MKVVFRADASLKVGTGHVMRCLTLADALAQRGATSQFLSRVGEGDLHDYIRDRGHGCIPMAPSLNPASGSDVAYDVRADLDESEALLVEHRPDLVVLDHYDLDAAWRLASCKKLLVVDDFGIALEPCTYILNQNPGFEASDYPNAAPTGTHMLLGPEFALVRPDFAALRSSAIAARKTRPAKELLVSVGGVDFDNVSQWVLCVLGTLPGLSGFHVTVLVGKDCPHVESLTLAAQASLLDIDLVVGSRKVEGYMAKADVAIGAGGTTSWERCVLGLPTVVLVIAQNQEYIASELARLGVAVAAEVHSDESLAQAIHSIATGASARDEMAQRAADLCDGLGAMRVCDLLLGDFDRSNPDDSHD